MPAFPVHLQVARLVYSNALPGPGDHTFLPLPNTVLQCQHNDPRLPTGYRQLSGAGVARQSSATTLNNKCHRTAQLY